MVETILKEIIDVVSFSKNRITKIFSENKCSFENEKGEEGGNLSISEVETVEMVSNIWKDFS